MVGEKPQYLSWEKWHEEWLKLQEVLQERDDRQGERYDEIMAATQEARDSFADMHAALLRLPCKERAEDHRRLSAKIDELAKQSIPWRSVLGSLTGKRILAAVGLLATALGWDRAADMFSKWGR